MQAFIYPVLPRKFQVAYKESHHTQKEPELCTKFLISYTFSYSFQWHIASSNSSKLWCVFWVLVYVRSTVSSVGRAPVCRAEARSNNQQLGSLTTGGIMLAVIRGLVSVEMIVSLGGFVKLLALSPSFILFLSSLVKSKALIDWACKSSN